MARFLIAAVPPVIVIALFAARGWMNVDHFVMLGGLVLLTFAPAYLCADFLLSLFGRGQAEEDAPRAARSQ